jgi:hypothetical protein
MEGGSEGGQAGPGFGGPAVIQVTPEEKAAIDRVYF